MVPPAPPRFSTTIGWPSSTASGSNTVRGMTSVALPALNGMKALIGFAGQVCATAAPLSPASRTAPPRRQICARVLIMLNFLRALHIQRYHSADRSDGGVAADGDHARSFMDWEADPTLRGGIACTPTQ